MRIDDADVRDLGLDLEHTPRSTRLRLPSSIGAANGVGLGFFGLVALPSSAFLVWKAASGPDPSLAAIGVASAIAVGMMALIHRVLRWLRYGAVVRITPDRLVIRKHWSGGEEAIAIDLDQVRIEPDRRGILVAGGRRRVRIGTGLGAEDRRSVAEFLSAVIAGHREAAGRAGVAPEGVTSEATPGVEADAPDADLLLLALCRRCRRADPVGAGRGLHLAPDIPRPLLIAALENYLEIRDDEVLLGIVGLGEKGSAGAGCALTTRRIYWPGRMTWSSGGRPPRCRWLDYSSLPEAIEATGLDVPTIVLGTGRRIVVEGGRRLAVALASFLRAARSIALGEAPAREETSHAGTWAGRPLLPLAGRGRPALAFPLTWTASGIQPSEWDAARAAWPGVVDAGRKARALDAEVRGFRGRFLAARPLVTPAIVGICIAVYALMVVAASQERPQRFAPDHRQMVAWGANFGPATVIDGQTWRLFTSVFLHFGLIHLLFNMYCLATAGPVVERLFGHLGFAGLYLIAGAGGSIASLCVHPTVISAGASGAIFGVFGALLGFLALRHDEVPADRLRPMAGGTLAFVGYNLLFGLGAPGIDMAAHLGGLVIGFGGGLLLTAATPARSSAPGGPGPAMGRLAAMAALSLVLAGTWPRASGTAREGILADPQMGRAIAAELDAVDAWNAFFTAAAPLLRDFDRIADEMQRVLSGAEEGRIQDDAIGRAVDRLRRDCRALDPRVAGLPAGNAEIRAMRDRIVAGHSLQLRMLDAIEQFLRTGDDSHLKGPGGLSASGEAYGKEFEAMENQREAYFRAHSMRPMGKTP